MAVRTAGITSATQTVGVKLDIDPLVQILTPADVPLQSRLSTDTTSQVKVEWLEEELTPSTITMSSKTGTGPWTLTVADSTPVRAGDVLWLQGAAAGVQFLVDSVTNSTTVVVSAFAGNATAPGTTDTFVIIGQYFSEGGDPQSPRSVERTNPYNYTQVGQESVITTRTAAHRGARGGLYGQGDPHDHEIMKKFKELAIRFERSLAIGQRTQSGDKRFMGGLLYFISTNSSSGVKANIKTLLNDLIRYCYNNGGSGRYTLMVSPNIKAVISTLNDTYVKTERSETRAGSVVDTFLSDFGEVDIVANRHFPQTKGVAYMGEYLDVINFDPYFYEDLAQTGDSRKGEIVGEKSLRVKNEKAHGVLTVTDA